MAENSLNARLESIKGSLHRLPLQKRLVLAASALVLMTAILWMSFNMAKPSMALLYSGLDLKTMSELTDKLDGMKTVYEIDGDSIYVDRTQRDKVRMDMAKQGLPRQGQAGYEILETLSGFGTTSEMFEASYWRAREGELARTISSIGSVEEARVHIAPPAQAAFQRQQDKPSASVMVRMRGGSTIAPENAAALRHLVALAVKGLQPAQVAIIDAATGQVIGKENTAPGLDPSKKIALEQRLQGQIVQLLGAHVGMDKVKASVNVDLDLQENVISRRSIDPESRTAISTDTQETKEQSQNSGSQRVSVAENIPEADNGGGGGSQSQRSRSESHEKVNYEISETREEQRQYPGGIKRLSVAILVDGISENNANGEAEWRARNAEELEALEKLARSAIGINEDRGDQLTIESMPFEIVPVANPAPSLLVQLMSDYTGTILESIALLAALLFLIYGVIKPLFSGAQQDQHQSELENLRVSYESKIQELLPSEEELEEEQAKEEATPLQLAMERAKELVQENPEGTLELLRRWLNDKPMVSSENPALEAPKDKPLGVTSNQSMSMKA